MKHPEFKIGGEFFTEGGRWRCTDLGTRTVIAIQISVAGGKKAKESLLRGPPYAVDEVVFDEDDFPGCHSLEDRL